MRIPTPIPQLAVAAALAASLSGCYTYPVYQPATIARLTPEQSAAIASNTSLSQADRDRLTRDNAQAVQQNTTTYAYATPVAPAYYPAPAAYYDPYYYGYPYWGGFYPGVSLSFGYRGYYGGGWHGGWHHR